MQMLVAGGVGLPYFIVEGFKKIFKIVVGIQGIQ